MYSIYGQSFFIDTEDKKLLLRTSEELTLEQLSTLDYGNYSNVIVYEEEETEDEILEHDVLSIKSEYLNNFKK